MLEAWRRAVILALALMGCGGGGGGGGGSPNLFVAAAGSSGSGAGVFQTFDNPSSPSAPVTPTTPSTPESPATPTTPTTPTDPGATNPGGSVPQHKTFAVLGALSSIASFSDPNPALGSNVAVRLFKGFDTVTGTLGQHIAYDAPRDRLYVSKGASIMVVDNASTASGTITPARTITPSGTGYGTQSYLVFDAASDVLWLGVQQNSNGMLLKFDNASTAQATVVPSRKYPMSDKMSVLAIDTTRSLL